MCPPNLQLINGELRACDLFAAEQDSDKVWASARLKHARFCGINPTTEGIDLQ